MSQALILSCSLNPASRSARLASCAFDALAASGVAVQSFDLRDHPLPMCDGAAAYADPAVARLAQAIRDADAVLLALPVYNYGVNAAAKNLVELTGRAWTGKTVGLICSAGGRGSYMSVMPFANTLMLDFRCLILPRFVYATEDQVPLDDDLDETVIARINQLANETLRLSTALRDAGLAPANR